MQESLGRHVININHVRLIPFSLFEEYIHSLGFYFKFMTYTDIIKVKNKKNNNV